MIHGHGDDLYKSQVQIKANFSTNVWYEADTRPLCDFLSTHLEGIFHYPDPDAGSFRKVAAAYHGLTPEQVLVGNGATELFYMVAHAFSGNRTLIPVPSFTEYEDACTLYDHHIQFVGQVDVEHIPEHTNLMFICNPNNPDGRIWNLEEITALVKNYPDMMLVVDESFIHFAPGTESALSLLKEYSNLLVIKSMTKCYAIPGLRLGYMLGNPAIVEFVACFGQPWSVNALAIEAGKFLLRHGGEGLPDASLLRIRQQEFAAQMARISGFRPLPSGTSFFLVETDYNSSALKKYLLEKHGLLIRDASNFRGLDTHYFRVNTLTEAKNRLLLEALESVDKIKLEPYE